MVEQTRIQVTTGGRVHARPALRIAGLMGIYSGVRSVCCRLMQPALSIVFSITLTASAIADELPTSEEVAQHIRDWRQDFEALRIGFETTWPRVPERRIYREMTIMGKDEYHEIVDEYIDPQKPRRTIFGGKHRTWYKPIYTRECFQASYTLDAQTNEWKLNGCKQSVQARHSGHRSPFTPLSPIMQPYHYWLDEYPLSDILKVEAFEQLEGEDCIRISVIFDPEADPKGQDFVAWLVPSKDFLPKKSMSPEVHDKVERYHICDKFENDGERWYPLRGRFVSIEPSGTYETNWEVTKFDVNPEVSPLLFVPPDDPKLRKKRQAEAEKRRAAARSNPAGEPSPDGTSLSLNDITWVVAFLAISAFLSFGYYRLMKSSESKIEN